MAVGLLEALPHTKLDLGEMMMLHQMDIPVMKAAMRDCQILMSPEKKLLSQCSHAIIIIKKAICCSRTCNIIFTRTPP
jgi:hypothetical protein